MIVCCQLLFHMATVKRRALSRLPLSGQLLRAEQIVVTGCQHHRGRHPYGKFPLRAMPSRIMNGP